jgi:hypothetical protein
MNRLGLTKSHHVPIKTSNAECKTKQRHDCVEHKTGACTVIETVPISMQFPHILSRILITYFSLIKVIIILLITIITT